MARKIAEDLMYIGQNDRELDLFEGMYPVADGMAYNSYALLDEKIAVLDTMDRSKTGEWLAELEDILDGRLPDYLIVHHMEPDHSASLRDFMEKYPEVIVVGNAKTFPMIGKFFPELEIHNKLVVKEGERLSLGRHSLTFLMAPMVHWPEVMMSYEATSRTLFSADAFGKFGAWTNEDEDWTDEARRYYFGIVGKFGVQVQALLKKVARLDITRICPLHGPVLTEDLSRYVGLYDSWSAYRPDSRGVAICYSTVYGNTRQAAERLAEKLTERGTAVVLIDLTRTDISYAVSAAFQYDTLVLATTTYNGGVFPAMERFVHWLTERNFQHRRVAIMENGAWVPTAGKRLRAMLESAKDITFTDNSITIHAALTEDCLNQIDLLALELAEEI